MTMKELIQKAAKETGLQIKQVEDCYNAIINAIYEETTQEEVMSITIPKIGILKTSVKEAYTAKNPMTGEPVEVPRTRQVRMTICKALKDKVKEGTKDSKKKASKKVEKKADKKAKAGAGKKTVAKKAKKK